MARKGREKRGWDPMGIAETGGKTEEDSRESKAGGTAGVTRGTDQVRDRSVAVRAPAEGSDGEVSLVKPRAAMAWREGSREG